MPPLTSSHLAESNAGKANLMKVLATGASILLLAFAAPAVANDKPDDPAPSNTNGAPHGLDRLLSVVQATLQSESSTPPGFSSEGKHKGWFQGRRWGWFKDHNPHWPHASPVSP
jgi:hypothetical protein